MESQAQKPQSFLQRKDVIISFKRYGIDAMGTMALGLFASLIIGLMLTEAGGHLDIELLVTYGYFARNAAGFAIGVSIAHALKAPPLVLFAAAAIGFAGNDLGGPAGALIASIVGVEIGKLVSKETPLDIMVTPFATLIAGGGIALLVGPPIGAFMDAIGSFIMWATELVPAIMGTLVGLVMGITLTSPISSAAIGLALGLEGIAAGAAAAGAAANMVCFAVISYRENKIGGLISQGLGTSMFQLPNIMRNPKIWIPSLIASGVGGFVSTVVFRLENIPAGSGMGASGLVGPFGALSTMGYTPVIIAQVLFVFFILPSVVGTVIAIFMRKKGWIKPGDMKLHI